MWPAGPDHHVRVKCRLWPLLSIDPPRRAYRRSPCAMRGWAQPLQPHQVHGDDLLVGQGRLSSDHARAFQILYAQPFIFSNDVRDLVPGGIIYGHSSLPCVALKCHKACFGSRDTKKKWKSTWILPRLPRVRSAQSLAPKPSCNPEVWGIGTWNPAGESKSKVCLAQTTVIDCVTVKSLQNNYCVPPLKMRGEKKKVKHRTLGLRELSINRQNSHLVVIWGKPSSRKIQLKSFLTKLVAWG